MPLSFESFPRPGKPKIKTSGGGSTAAVSRSDVNFYDYDGTLLYAYTVAQANALIALPTAPTHIGLTFQEWNYTLSEVTATTHPLDIGATYITDDGKTRLYIEVGKRLIVPLYWTQTVSEGVTVDWGDGTSMQTFSGTGNKNTTHTYPAAGNYTILLDASESCILGLGNGSVTAYTSVIGGTNQGYNNTLIKAELGNNISEIGRQAFYKCAGLNTITISNSVSSIGYGAFYYARGIIAIILPKSISSLSNDIFYYCSALATLSLSSGINTVPNNLCYSCYKLRYIAFPDTIVAIGASAFRTCISLASVFLSTSLTSIGNSSFSESYGLTTMTIPASVTTIDEGAFGSIPFFKEYHFLSTTPPTLGSSVFYQISADCVIYVPFASVDTYKAASGWSSYASHIVGE